MNSLFKQPFNHFKGLSFAYGKCLAEREYKKKPKIFLMSTLDEKKLVVVTYRGRCNLSEQFLFIRYCIVSSWNEFLNFMYEIFYTTEQLVKKDEKLMQIKKNVFKE